MCYTDIQGTSSDPSSFSSKTFTQVDITFMCFINVIKILYKVIYFRLDFECCFLLG